MIELTQPRTIVIEDRGKQYQLTVARISEKQWKKYFDGIVSTSENQAGKRTDSFDSSAARLALVDSVLTNAVGYMTDQPLTSITDWQQKLPLSHRQGVGAALTNVSRSERDDEQGIALGSESVFLDAVWGADEKLVMRKYRGLRHTFSTPSAEQQHRYSRDASRSVLVGGTRNAKTRWLGPQSTLITLYDELVREVEGYTVRGETPDREAVIEHMDAYHKVAAASELFAPALPNVESADFEGAAG